MTPRERMRARHGEFRAGDSGPRESPVRRIGLLVSVRDAEEAAIAVAAAADVVDVKEPSRGPLGAADPAVLAEVADVVAGRVPLSAALGEVCDRPAPLPASVAARLQFIKLGLAGCATVVDWPARWQRATESYAADLTRVAVIYADWRAARAPTPNEMLAWAAEGGCGALLVDTFDKRGGGLAELWSLEAVAELVAAARQLSLPVALAGSLTAEAIRRYVPLGPAFVGVRGAACLGGREGRLDAGLVSALLCAVASPS